MTRRAALVAAGLTLTLMLGACADRTGATPSKPPRTEPASTATSSAPAVSATPSPPSVAQIRATIGTELAKIIKSQPQGAVSVAALNTRTGQRFVGGQTSGMWTASAYKLFCLSAILMHSSPSSLSGAEVTSAQEAIENSNNVAGYQLFLDAGGRPGLIDAAEDLGMTHTVPGESDPTFTTTSGADYLRLLEAITGHFADDPLSPAARQFILNLMGQVESDQRWGIGSAAQPGTNFYNKNGWLSISNGNGPGENDNGLWAVTSVGVLTVAGQQVLMAIFTRHQPDFATGVSLVNRLAKLIAPAVAR